MRGDGRRAPRGPAGPAPAARVVALALLAAAACGREPAAEADLILDNVRMATPVAGPAAAPAKVAAAIAGGRFLAIGDGATVGRHRGPRTRTLDMGGALLAAGMEDGLVRPIEAGERLLNEAGGGMIFLDLSDAETEEDAVQRVRVRARALGPGAWILGGGWDERRWVVPRPPDARLLSDIVQSNPVFLARRGGDAAWVNRRALAAAGVEGAPVPVTGEARDAVLRRAPALTEEERRAAIAAVLARSAASGVIAVHAVASTGRLGIEDPAAPAGAVLDPWRDLARRGGLPVRVALLVPAPSAAAEALIASGPESYPGGGRLEIRALLLDASAGAAGAEARAGWARRGATAGLDIAVAARDAAGLAAAPGLIAEARRAGPGSALRLVLGAGLRPGPPEIEALARSGVAVVIEAPPDEAAAGDLARTLREAGIEVAAGSGSADRLPAAMRRWTRGPWTSAPVAGGPADFLVLPGDALPVAADPGTEAPLEPLSVWIGGVEVHGRRAAPRPPG